MRRLAILPVLAVTLLAGCSQVTQFAGETVGVPVEKICTTFDDAYAQYETLLETGDATEEQVEAARDDLVAILEDLAEDVDGQVGDVIRTNAERLSETADIQSPDAVAAIEQARDSVSAFCG
ncbi:hypothetical protein [Microbacterium karelineae]|uniref:hypothetical protein n=1 Tax=Microbacterium karelineae TaxID=2654283 RepID=UPI0012EA10E9|nr:hypothetical protein [Microbacterium karelineae]